VTEEKVELVEEYKEEYGLNTCLVAIDLPKTSWYHQKKKKVDYEQEVQGTEETGT